MPIVQPGYSRATYALKTASGKASVIRGLDPQTSTIERDDKAIVRVVEAVTDYVKNDALEKSAKEAKEKAGEVVRTYVSTVREACSLDGDYQKTYRVLGNKIKSVQYAVDAAHQDKWTLPKAKEDLEALRKALGPHADSLMEEETVISIKKEVMENNDLRKELSCKLFEALGTEGLKKYFEKEEIWTIKKGLAERQYKLEKTVRETLKARLKQAADSLKDASEPVV